IEANPMHADVTRAVARHYRRVDTLDELVPGIDALLDQLAVGRPGAAVLEVDSSVLTGQIAGELAVPHHEPTPPPIPTEDVAEADLVLVIGAPLAGARGAAP